MILITGSSGFIGRHLIPKLIKKKYKICCLLRQNSSKRFLRHLIKNKVKFVFGSLTDYKSLDKALKNVSISKIIHLAGIIKSGNKSEYANVNVKSTSNLIRVCKKKKVKQFIFMSSDVVSKREITLYGKSKYQAELIIRKSGMPYVFLRSTVIYGKGDNKLIMKLVDIIKKMPVIPVIGSGEYIFQPVFIDDIVDIITKCLDMESKKIYDVCCDETLTLNQIIDIISHALNKKIYKIHIPIFLIGPVIKLYESIFSNPIITKQQLDYFQKRTKIDNSLIKKELNFKFTDFRDGILKSISSSQ